MMGKPIGNDGWKPAADGTWEAVSPDQVMDPEGMQEAQRIADNLQPRHGKRYGKLQGLYGTVGMLTMSFDPTCGMGILQNAEQTAAAVDRLCSENPQIAKIVDRVLTGSAVMELLAAHAPLFMVVMEHHFPGGFRMPWIAPETEPSENGQPTYVPE